MTCKIDFTPVPFQRRDIYVTEAMKIAQQVGACIAGSAAMWCAVSEDSPLASFGYRDIDLFFKNKDARPDQITADLNSLGKVHHQFETDNGAFYKLTPASASGSRMLNAIYPTTAKADDITDFDLDVCMAKIEGDILSVYMPGLKNANKGRMKLMRRSNNGMALPRVLSYTRRGLYLTSDSVTPLFMGMAENLANYESSDKPVEIMYTESAHIVRDDELPF